MADTNTFSNIAKGFSADGIPIRPSAYNIKSVVLVNKEGEATDINRLVTSLAITEELFSPVLVCTLAIRDDENLFENAKIDGQEIIQIEIEFYELDGGKKVDIALEFRVKQYPGFTKSLEALNLQKYSIIGISSFAYISQLTKVSYGFPSTDYVTDGDPILEIKKIFEKFLLFKTSEQAIITEGLEKISGFLKNFGSKLSSGGGSIAAALSQGASSLINKAANVVNSASRVFNGPSPNYLLIDSNSKSVVKLKGNVTRRSPLAAVEFFRTKATDADNTPFFVYNRIGLGIGGAAVGDTVIIQSLKSILDSNIYNSYRYIQGVVTEEGEVENPALLRHKILAINSDIQIDKLKQASAGVFGNTLAIYDYANKQFVGKLYDPYSDTDLLPELSPPEPRPFAELFNHEGELNQPEKVAEHAIFDLHVPPLQDNSAGPHLTGPEYYSHNLNKMRYYSSRLLDDTSHEIEVYGDINLNPGTKITLEIPEAKAYNEPSGKLDKTLSGDYLTVVAHHSFTDGVYISRVKLVKLKTN